MSVYKRGKTWQAIVYFKDKRMAHKGGFKTKKEANEWHDIEKAKIRLRKGNEPIKKAVTFDELITKYCQLHLPTIRPSTAQRYLIDINQRILPFFQFYKLSKVNVEMVEEFRSELLQHISVKSVNNCIGLLKNIFKKANDWELIEKNSLEKIKLQKITEQKYTWWEDEDDIKKFILFARNDRYFLAYRFALDFGLRLGEIVGLVKKDINLEIGQIHVYRQWLDKQDKYGPTKQGRERFLRYSSDGEFAKLIKNHLKEKEADDPLFTTTTGKIIRPRKLSGHHFQRLIEKSGVPRIRFHDLRHTFASWYMIKNDNIWDLMRILGHADVQTTQRYAHLSSAHKLIPSFSW